MDNIFNETKTVIEKYIEILSSPRLHQIVLAFIVMTLAHYGVIDAWMADAISTVLGLSVTVNTVDRFNKVAAPTVAPVIVAPVSAQPSTEGTFSSTSDATTYDPAATAPDLSSTGTK